MAEELRIRVIFDTDDVQRGSRRASQGTKVFYGSIENLEKRLMQVNQSLKRYVVGSDRYNAALKVQGKLSNELAAIHQKNQVQMAQSTRTSANMTMALQSMNFTIRDSPYFFRDFSLGILAIGNNLNPLIDSLIAVKREAKAAGSSLRRELWTALKGPGGVIFAFSVLVSVMQAVVFAMDGTDKKTKDNAESSKDLAKRIRDLAASYEELAEAQTKYRNESAIAEKISAINLEVGVLQDQRDALRALPFLTQEQEKQLTRIIQRIAQLQGRASTFSKTTAPELQKNLSLLRNMVGAVKGDDLGVFIATSGLTKEQLDNLRSQLIYLRDSIFTVSGSIREGLDPSLQVIVDSLAMTKDEVISTIDAFDKFFGTDKTEKVKQQLTFLQEIRKEYADLGKELAQINQDLETANLTERERNLLLERRLEIYKEIDGFTFPKFEELFPNWSGIKEGGTAESAPPSYLEQFRQERQKIQEEINKINQILTRTDLSKEEEKILTERRDELTAKLSGIESKAQITTQTINALGTAIYQAFLQGKLSADEFLKTLVAITAQMVIMDGLKSIFSGGAVGIFSLLGFQKGGIIGAQSGAILDGTSYSGDRQLFLGNAGEMVLNRQQQKNLLAMLTYGKMKNQKLKVEVAVTGHLRANKNEFISDFKKAEKNFNKGLIKVVDSY